MRFTPRRFLATLLVVAVRAGVVGAQGPRQPFSRVAVTVTPDRADWTYRPGDPVSFRIDVLRDGHPVQGATVKYGVGPEMLPPSTEATAVVGERAAGRGGGHDDDAGFLRLVATVEIDGRTYRGVGTAGFSPEQIQPTQTNPADFDAFWDGERARLAALPIDARWTPLPDYGTAEAELLAGQSAERRRHRGRQPALRHPLHAQGGGKVSRAAERAGGGRAAVSRLGRDGGPRRHHAADRHSRHPRDSAAGGLRQPRARRRSTAIPPSVSTRASATTTGASTPGRCAPTTS